jgi:hypothetical protein
MRSRTESRFNRFGGTALTIAVAVCFTPKLHASYTFQDIINPGDITFNQALGINNAGNISGYYGSGAAGHPNKGYTSTPPYISFTSENFPGSAQTQVVGINNSGTTVGFWSNTDMGVGMDANFGFTDVGGTFTSVIDPSTPAVTTTTNQLLGVNDSNIAVGFYVDATGNPQGYLYNVTSMTFTSFTVPVANNSILTGINNAGVLAGFYNNAGSDVGFIDNGGTFQYIQAFGDSTMLLGLNNDGYAVGTYVDGLGQNHGFLYDIATMTYITIDDPSAALGTGNGTTLNGINDKNQLVGFYVNGDGNTIGLIADPVVSEPASLALVGFGLLVVGAYLRKAGAGAHHDSL